MSEKRWPMEPKAHSDINRRTPNPETGPGLSIINTRPNKGNLLLVPKARAPNNTAWMLALLFSAAPNTPERSMGSPRKS